MIGCIALYDFDVEQFQLEKWLMWTEFWMDSLECSPNTMGLPHSGKFLQFRNGKRKLEKNGYNIENIDFYGGGEPRTDHAWKLAASFDKDNKTTYLCFDPETLSFSCEALERLLISLYQFCDLKYAIGFEREGKYGPDYYARGYAHGLKYAYQDAEHGKERARIFAWQEQYHCSYTTYKTGDLRDIYPFNVLSQSHLDRDINGQRLEDWINSSSDRGALKKVTDTLWTWWIDADSIPAVREALIPTGIILCP